ncbi:hypothetical protein USB125703_00049 [Pseudoclavibacter triregionum]|nr:hypothetical protein USB125703_00049 [Pseudoclavibacter triregionum]
MSRIDDLIAELCPNGVEFKTLGEVLRIKNGKDYKPLGDGDIPVYGSGGIMRYVDTAAGEGPSVLIPRKGSLGNIFYVEGPFWVVDTIFRTEIDFSQVEPKFVYHQLLTMKLGEMNQAGGVPSQTQTVLNSLRIPVPPLEVQREIVRVLDPFTQLEAELEAELEARRRQYEHYRQLAMSFDDSIPRVALGDIAEVRSGWGFPNVHQGREEGEYPFYKVGDMNLPGNETVMSIANNYVSAEVAKNLGVRPAPAGTVIFPKIGAAVATNKKRVLSVPSAYDNNVMGLVPTERVTSRFLYHWMQTFDLSRLANDSGAVPSIRKTEAEKVRIPLPDLDTQRKVAGLLDKFDALVNDLSVGLPAELAARRNQYEYYRDKLLTFEEAV